jgi:hypothetical protein
MAHLMSASAPKILTPNVWQILVLDAPFFGGAVPRKESIRYRKDGPMKTKRSAVVLGILVTTASLTLVGCGSSAETLVLTQGDGESVVLTELESNPSGVAGDTTVFEGPVEKDGEPYGSIMGSMTKVGALGAGWREDREERMLTAVFDLPSGQISVLGVSYYFEGDELLPAGEPVTRSIVGGTGDYVGIDGEVTTVRNEDGSYTHTLSIIR